jgi:hypothetical protein
VIRLAGDIATAAVQAVERRLRRVYDDRMSVEEIEKAFVKLPLKERARLLEVLAELDAAEFDAKIEADIKAGKLDKLAEQALAEHAAGKTKPL